MTSLLTILVLAALGLLVWVFWHGLARPGRLRQFAGDHDGEHSAYDAFELRELVDPMFDDDRYVGHAVALDDPDELNSTDRVYLCDLHVDPGGSPAETALLLQRRAGPDGESLTIRARLASPESGEASSFHDLFAVEGDDDVDVPERLAAFLTDNVETYDWLPEVRLERGYLLVVARDRVLGNAEQWEELLEFGLACRKTLAK